MEIIGPGYSRVARYREVGLAGEAALAGMSVRGAFWARFARENSENVRQTNEREVLSMEVIDQHQIAGDFIDPRIYKPLAIGRYRKPPCPERGRFIGRVDSLDP